MLRLMYVGLLLVLIACHSEPSTPKEVIPPTTTPPTKKYDTSFITYPRGVEANWLYLLRGRNGEEQLTYTEFEKAFIFGRRIDLNAQQRYLVLAMDYGEPTWEFILIQQTDTSKTWEIQDHYQVIDRLVPTRERLHWDAYSQWLYRTIEQEWSSNGTLQRYLFLRPIEQGWKAYTNIHSSGGQEIDHYKGFSIETYFYSSMNSLGADFVKLTYHYQLTLNSTCDARPFKGTVLQDSTSIRYYLSDKEEALLPDWSSLKKLNQTQFVSLIGWADLEGFEALWRQWVAVHRAVYPKTADAVTEAFLK